MSRVKIRKIISYLKKGGLIIYPTETAYALGCDAMNKDAVLKVFLLKKRLNAKTLPLIAGDIGIVKRFAYINGVVEKFARKFWPGPLTLILKARKKFPTGVMNQKGEIAIRVSGNSFARNISKKLNHPIISTSANLSGRETAYSLNKVIKQFGKNRLQNVLLVDGGRIPRRKVSTIARVNNNKVEILRKGAVKI